jgi:hypothetical protein
MIGARKVCLMARLNGIHGSAERRPTDAFLRAQGDWVSTLVGRDSVEPRTRPTLPAPRTTDDLSLYHFLFLSCLRAFVRSIPHLKQNFSHTKARRHEEEVRKYGPIAHNFRCPAIWLTFRAHVGDTFLSRSVGNTFAGNALRRSDR